MNADELFRSHGPFVARFLRRLGVIEDELDDALQEVFLVAHRKGGYTAGAARPTTWLAEIALRIVSDSRRSKRLRPCVLDEEAVSGAPAHAVDPLAAATSAEALRRVQDALLSLDPLHRAVFVLFELEDEPCEAIAAALGVPVGTVHSRLFNARRAFRSAYDRLTIKPVPPRPFPALVRNGEAR